MENASHAFLDDVRKSMRQVRVAIGTATVNPKLLTSAERLQYEVYLRREEANAVIRGLFSEGISIKELVRRTGHSRKLVRRVVGGQRTDIFRVRQTSLERHLPWLQVRWNVGLRNGAELWGQLRLAGFGSSLRVVTEWATRRRRAEKAENGLGHARAARTIVRLMTLELNNLTKAQSKSGYRTLARLGMSLRAYHNMLRRKSKDDLEAWIDCAERSLFASFANGVVRDRAAIQNAMTSQWSNGQTEGQITKLKLIKRQMYRRGKLDLLDARIVGAPLMSSKSRQTQHSMPIDTAPILGIFANEAPRWVSWALGDLCLKVLVGIIMLLPYGALMSTLKPMPPAKTR
jgi:transposase